jgi:hypothetical protein
LAGVLIDDLTCSPHLVCGGYSQYTTTDSDGAYRITDLYAGNENYVWITKDGYEPVDPEMPNCDNCNEIVEMNGDTRLDIELVRR